MTLKDLEKKFLDRTDLKVACALAFGVACWALMFGLPCPHPDFWTDFAAAARIRPAKSVLDAFWLFPVGAVFDLLGVGKALSVCGFLGRVGLGLTCGGVYLCLRAFWYELLNYEAPELPKGLWDTRFGSIAGALGFCLFAFTWKEAQYLTSGLLTVQLGIASILLWLRSRHSHGIVSASAAYALCGTMAAVHPVMLAAAVAFIVCDIRSRRLKMFLELEGDKGVELMMADQRTITATGISLFFGMMFGLAVCLASAYRFAIVPEAKFWDLFDVWFGDWGGAFADMFVTPGVIALALFVAAVFAVLSGGRKMRMTMSGGVMFRNIFLTVLLIVCCALGLRRMTGTDGERLNAIRQYADALAESCRADVSWLFTDGTFDDLVRLEMRVRGVQTAVMSLVSAPTKAEAEAFRAYAPEMLDGDMFAAGGSEVFKYWAQERTDRMEQSAWLMGSETVLKFDAEAPIGVSGGVVRYGRAALSNDVAAVEREMVRLAVVVEQIARRSVSPFEHADRRVKEVFRCLLRRLAGLSEERRRGYEKVGDVLKARSEQEKIHHYDALIVSLLNDGAAKQSAEWVRPTSTLVLTPQEGLDVALKRRDYVLAMRFARPVLEANPTNILAHFAMGMAYVQAKDDGQAVWHFKEIVKSDPRNESAHMNLTKVYLRLGQRENALERAEIAARHCPDSGPIRRTLAEIRKESEGSKE